MYTQIITPVRPLPALQWMAATFSGLAVSHSCTSSEYDSISSMGGALWSSNG